MALGLIRGEIENSRLRVLRRIARMALGRNAFADDVDRFDRIMNLGHRLALWFTREYGSTQCRALTGCDFSQEAGVASYVTRRLVDDAGTSPPASRAGFGRCRGKKGDRHTVKAARQPGSRTTASDRIAGW